MNIHVKNWKLEHGQITNLDTGEVRRVEGLPSAGLISHMSYEKCVRKCAEAFRTGKWPLTRKVCRFCKQERFEQ
jgi:hypothetical protein